MGIKKWFLFNLYIELIYHKYSKNSQVIRTFDQDRLLCVGL
jgi:hypothetical protein